MSQRAADELAAKLIDEVRKVHPSAALTSQQVIAVALACAQDDKSMERLLRLIDLFRASLKEL